MTRRPDPFYARGAPLLAFVVMTMASVWVAGCAPPAALSPTADPREQAAAEATAIVQRAQATALVLKAQAEATALIRAANAADVTNAPISASEGSTAPPPATRLPVTTLESASAAATRATSLASATAEIEKRDAPESTSAGAVELVNVEIGQESGTILVQFKAPPSLARKWQQGSVFVVDEATGNVYSEIPVAPVIGPLFARPKEAGQMGYVMFSNAPTALQAGARVTVVLGDFKQEHVTAK